MGKKSFQQTVLGKLGIHVQKNEVGPLPNTYTKINSKWIKNLNIRSKTIKLLEKNSDIGFGNGFLDLTPKAEAIKGKIHKLDLMKIKNFSASKNTIKSINWQLSEWERTLANHLSDKGLISGIHRELLKLNNSKKQLDSKMGKGLKQTFL